MGRTKSLEVVIDQLVLHGASNRERDRLVSALESELGRLSAGAPIDARTLPKALEQVRIDLPPGLAPDDVGRRIAGSIWSARAAESNPPQPAVHPERSEET